jgi:hypothetical protein
MKKQPKVLVLSRDSWNTTNNSGNTLSNLFQNWETFNIANIYCRDEVPNNNICSNYYKISESLLIKKMLGKKNVAGEKHGAIFSTNSSINPEQLRLQNSERKIYDFFRKNRWHLFLWLRELLWKIVNWKSKELEQFISDFQPEIIYSPSYDSFYMHTLLYFVKKNSSAKVVYFHCDDLVTYRQHSYSPFYWLNRFILRKYMDKSIQLADKNYCIIDEQASVYESIYKMKFDLLYKTGTFNWQPKEKKVQQVIKIVYTGNIIYGRIHTIIAIAKALKQINSNKKKAELYIYTANAIEQKYSDELLSTNSVQLLGKVFYEEIPNILNSADVLLHVESFEKQQKLATSLSFSTKLVDYFEASKPIFAIGWNKAASIKYLKNNSIGTIVSNPKKVMSELENLLENQNSFETTGNAIWQFGKERHNTNKVLTKFENQLAELRLL